MDKRRGIRYHAPMSTTEKIVAGLRAVRERHPLVHNITNYVVMNCTANALLALGASPVMAHAVEEVEEMASMAGAVVLNIGTLSPPWIEAMFRAGRAARAKGVPVVLDPVGAGATKLRTETARQLIRDVHPAVIRGNASEILALVEGGVQTRGVDSRHTVDQARDAARRIARDARCVVAVTGPEDYVTDGARAARIRSGHPLLARITGSGCMATAVVAALGAVEPDAFTAAIAGLVVFGIAGEMAAADAPRPGTFLVRLIDALDEIDDSDLRRGARVEESLEPA
jgi:hydroxyethylthiazole kinase